MKTAKPYLPFEFDFISNDAHSELIARYGAQGLGIYFMILMELRNHEGYRCRLATIKGAARRCMVAPEMLESVLFDFELFEFHQRDNRVEISSPYVDRVMQPYGEKTGKNTSTVSENTVTVEAPVHGRSTVTHREINNKIEIKIKTSTTVYKAATAADESGAAVADNLSELDKPFAGIPAADSDMPPATVEVNNILRQRPPPRICRHVGKTWIWLRAQGGRSGETDTLP